MPVIKKIKIADTTYDIEVDKDWNQNDANAIDYIKNRPFYTNGNVVQQLDAKYIPVDGSTIKVENNKLKAEDSTLVKFVDESGTESVLGTLEIHTQTQEQYDQKLSDGTLKDNAMYLTPFVLENSLNSESTTVALTAAAGKLLNDNKAEKTDVYTKQEINVLLDEVEGGSTESASSVKRALDTYIQSMDTEVFGAETVTEWRAGGTYNPDYSVDSRIDQLSKTMPSKTSDLINDSDFATTTDIQENIPGFAYYSVEAEKASGYLSGGQIDRMFKNYQAQIESLQTSIANLRATTISNLQTAINGLSTRILDLEDDGKDNNSNGNGNGTGGSTII